MLIWSAASLIALLAILAFLAIFQRHEHCIKNAGLALRGYATDHDERFPYHTNGFGNALLLLTKSGWFGGTNDVGPITGPGDDGAVFREALKTGAPIPEHLCSRIYIQGLSETNNPEIAILFDKRSTPGGDHSRRPWGPLLREVVLLDSTMKIIREEDWPAFSSNQVELLVREGFDRTAAAHFYQIP